MRTKTAMEPEEPLLRDKQPRPDARNLTAEEIGSLAKRMVESSDPQEKALLKKVIVTGLYGDHPHA